MAIKIKRRTRRSGITEPDQISSFNQDVFKYIEDNRKMLGIILTSFLLLVTAFSWGASFSSDRSEDRGAQILSATEALVIPAPAETLDGEGVDTLAMRAESLLSNQEIEGVVAGDIIYGIANFSVGELEQARAQFQHAVDSSTATSTLLNLQALAAVSAASGDLDSARQHLELLSSSIPSLSNFALLELARFTEASGQLEEAYGIYREVEQGLEVIAFDETSASVGLESGREDLQRVASYRAEIIAIQLNIEQEDVESDEGSAVEQIQ
jgi:tetratricopeptide (TPR) repeat protein